MYFGKANLLEVYPSLDLSFRNSIPIIFLILVSRVLWFEWEMFSHWLVYLKTWFPAGGSVLKDCGALRRWEPYWSE